MMKLIFGGSFTELVNMFLSVVDCCVNSPCPHTQEGLYEPRFVNMLMDMERILALHVPAFNAGAISLERLLHVVVAPFFELARKANRETEVYLSGFSQETPFEGILKVWSRALCALVSSSEMVVGKDGVRRWAPLLTPERRREVFTALNDANFCQVNAVPTQHTEISCIFGPEP